jgi:hypothetical protein
VELGEPIAIQVINQSEMSKLLLVTLALLIAYAFSAAANSCGEAGTTVLAVNILDEVDALAVTGGTVTPLPHDIYGGFTPNPGTEKSFKNMVSRLKRQAKNTNRKLTPALMEKCLSRYFYCSIDCKADFGLTNCKAPGMMSFATYTLKSFHVKYCVNPRLAAIKKAGKTPTAQERHECNMRPCSCSKFKDALKDEKFKWDGPNGSTYQGRFYARVVAYRALCKDWCASGVAPAGVLQNVEQHVKSYAKTVLAKPVAVVKKSTGLLGKKGSRKSKGKKTGRKTKGKKGSKGRKVGKKSRGKKGSKGRKVGKKSRGKGKKGSRKSRGKKGSKGKKNGRKSRGKKGSRKSKGKKGKKSVKKGTKVKKTGKIGTKTHHNPRPIEV